MLHEGEAKLFQPNTNDVYCAPPLYKIVHRKQIILFDTTDDDNYLYELCLMERTRHQSLVVMANITETKMNEIKLDYANFSPNMVLIFYQLSLDIIEHPILSFLFSSLRSYVFIIIKTEDDEYKCINGIFSEKAKSAQEDFLNRLWFKYHMFVVILEFPFVCPHYFVIYHGKLETNAPLYNRTIKSVPTNEPRLNNMIRRDSRNLLKGYPIRANLFIRFPTSINFCESIHFYANIDFNITQNMCGMDAFIMQDIINFFKFKVTFPVIENIDSFGYMISENNITGSLGFLLHNYFDISFNSRFMVKYVNGDEIKYLHYIGFDSICAIMKTPDYMPLWQYPFGSFDPLSWVTLVFIMLFIGVIAKGISLIKKGIGIKADQLQIINYLSLGFFGCMMKPTRDTISILRGTCLITSVIILSMFQGHINYMYTTMVRGHQLKTINDLRDSKVEIRTSPSVVKLLGSPDHLPILESQIYYDGYNNLSDLLVHDNWATLQRIPDVILETMRLNQIDRDGMPLLYLIDQCFCNYYVTYITRKDFPFANDLTVLLMRIVEAGLPEIYYRWTKNSLKLSAKMKLKYTGQKPRPFTPSTMQEQRIPFSLLLVGYILSTSVLIVERWWARRKQSVSEVEMCEH
ncbi:hypothetical protein evm_002590 [Chilo suppressalis]|nr:hypothetical protein evm_002590 [Chilo suppressalis]